jgi:pantetheine-phosphate adenylyltransferase
MILNTKNHQSHGNVLSSILNMVDTQILNSNNWAELLEYEFQIAKEYQVYADDEYRLARSNILRTFSKKYCNPLLNTLADHVEQNVRNIAIFAGSFNPFHLGHLDVLKQADSIFDKVIVAIGINPSKADFDGFDRLLELKKVLPHYEVNFFEGLLTSFVDKKQSKNVNITLVRGLRNGGDLDIELRSLRFMRDISPEMNVVYIPCRPEHEHISSSAVRELKKLGAKSYKNYLP